MLNLSDALRGPLKKRAADLTGTHPNAGLEVHTTPWQWVDVEGMYVGADGAWLYHELPMTLLERTASGTGLDALQAHLAATLPDRDLHLLCHAWEDEAAPAPGTPDALAEYLRESLRFLVPTRSLMLGIKLNRDPATPADTKARRVIVKVLENALGEAVPEFDRYTADRALITATLQGWTGGPPTRRTADYLESWYQLGTGTDERIIDTQDALLVGETGSIELASVMGWEDADRYLTGHLPASGPGSATVVSVRGVLTGSAKARGSNHLRAGALRDCSVVLGRRVRVARQSWADALRAQAGVELRPLPLRQLAALDETLPCSKRRVSPTLSAVTAAMLARVGVAENAAAGDPTGLFLGLADPDLANPCFLNPFVGGNLTVVTGEPYAGKTFLAEALSVQAALAGCDVTVFTTGARQGQDDSAVLELVGGLDVALGAPGHLNPFSHTEPVRAAQMAAHALPALIPGLTEQERSDLAGALRRGAATGATTLDECLNVITDHTAVARLRRAQRRSAFLPLVVEQGTDLLCGGGVRVVDLGWMLPIRAEGTPVVAPSGPVTGAGAADGGVEDGGVEDGVEEDSADDIAEAAMAAALVDLALACRLEWAMLHGSPNGSFIVVDGAASILNGPLSAASLERVRASGAPVHVLLTTRDTAGALTGALVSTAERVIALAESEPAQAQAAQRLARLAPTEQRSSWLALAQPLVDDEAGQILRPALALHRDARGRVASLLIGPVPTKAVPALTRGDADG